MNGLSLGALAKITSLAQPKPSWSLVRSAVSLSTCPRARMASMLIPAAVVPTFTDAQTRSVVESTSGSEAISRRSASVQPFWTSALKPPTKSTATSAATASSVRAMARRPSVLAGGHPADRADRYPAVHDRDAVSPLDLAADGAQPAGIMHQTVADPVAQRGQIRRGTRLKVDAHGHGADIELVLAGHAERGQNVFSAMQGRLLEL